MKNITRIIAILVLAISLLGGLGGVAAESLPSPQDEALLALINQARQNPLAAAAAMGMDPEKILKDLPQLEQILRQGLPAVTFNGTLSAVARAHTQDMFANGYYSQNSPDGRGYDARIRNSVYPAATTGESGSSPLRRVALSMTGLNSGRTTAKSAMVCRAGSMRSASR